MKKFSCVVGIVALVMGITLGFTLTCINGESKTRSALRECGFRISSGRNGLTANYDTEIPATVKRKSGYVILGKPVIVLTWEKEKIKSVSLKGWFWEDSKTDAAYQTRMHAVADRFEGQPVTKETLEALCSEMQGALREESAEREGD